MGKVIEQQYRAGSELEIPVFDIGAKRVGGAVLGGTLGLNQNPARDRGNWSKPPEVEPAASQNAIALCPLARVIAAIELNRPMQRVPKDAEMSLMLNIFIERRNQATALWEVDYAKDQVVPLKAPVGKPPDIDCSSEEVASIGGPVRITAVVRRANALEGSNAIPPVVLRDRDRNQH